MQTERYLVVKPVDAAVDNETKIPEAANRVLIKSVGIVNRHHDASSFYAQFRPGDNFFAMVAGPGGMWIAERRHDSDVLVNDQRTGANYLIKTNGSTCLWGEFKQKFLTDTVLGISPQGLWCPDLDHFPTKLSRYQRYLVWMLTIVRHSMRCPFEMSCLIMDYIDASTFKPDVYYPFRSKMTLSLSDKTRPVPDWVPLHCMLDVDIPNAPLHIPDGYDVDVTPMLQLDQ